VRGRIVSITLIDACRPPAIAQSVLMPASLMIPAQRADSAFIIAANSSGASMSIR
jgi:hypothetical protein